MDKLNKGKEIAAKRCFCYRNIKKDFTKFSEGSTITREAHLELGDHNQVVIVDDRKTDWLEKANKDVGSVGLRNALENLRRQGIGIQDVIDNQSMLFTDKEAIDTSNIDPLNPKTIKDVYSVGDEGKQKIDILAAQLGVPTEKLLKAFVDNKLDELIAAKINVSTHVKEEGGNQ